MNVLAIRKTSYDALRRNQQAVIQAVAVRIRLGEPTLFESGGGAQFYVFGHAFTPEDLARIGTATANVSDVPASWHVPLEPWRLEVDQAALWTALASTLGPKVQRRDGSDGTPFGERRDGQAILDEQFGSSQNAVLVGSDVPSGWTAIK